MSDPDAVRVAFDTGPLYGARTGIGFAVDAMQQHLVNRSDVEVQPYLVSYRAVPSAGTTRLPLPAALAHRLWSRGSHPRVDRWLASAQVVHGTNYVVPPSGLPTVVSVYDCWFLQHRADSTPAVRRAGDVLRAAVRRGAWVHTSSNATADAVRALLHTDRVRTVYLGPLPLPDPSPCDHPVVTTLAGAPFIVAIGTLERRKNLPLLVEAFGALDAPSVHLVIAGGAGDDTPTVEAAVARLPIGLRSRVHVVGRVDSTTRAWLLRHAAVLAYPSLDEGFGFPLLDAMQAGTPVVASSAGSLPEVAGDAALLVAVDDLDGLAGALHRAITDDTVRRHLIDAGAQQWQRFSWHRCAEELVQLYRQALTV